MKYMKNITLKSAMIMMLVSLGLISCSDDDSTPNGGKSNLTVRMTDAPGDYDAVFVDVQDVMIHVESETELEGDEDGDGWVSVGNVEKGVYDLLELTGGVTQLLASTEVPSGFVSQIRLVLGSQNRVVINGESKPLNTPSAQQAGLKLQVNQEFEAGENYAFLLDFNVDESVVTTGNGSYNLKPVIRLSAKANAGTVIGSVEPANIQSLVVLKNSSTTISAYTDVDGDFSLNGVPAGTYKLTVIPEVASGLTNYVVNDVVVEANSTTELELITL
ncbi:DUF4382 domain-containing protein [Christiangramia salexigens]|uniref:Carbohydrate-binding protein n=1 Tax=Christiangramia salexigens TaxID=1913577 RepID=A0A1L3J6I2_9FLAO|nr:DUF4382 domain-containing protein [Christiangramia salexigens]APG60713.1 carbohydrate-binding protein [Christiangramia salexigens]